MNNSALADGAAETAVPLLQVTNLTKEFPGVLAVNDVGLSVAPGEVVSLLGQNGAGKSTLIQVLSGVHPHGSYDGAVRINGELLTSNSVAQAEASGIAFLAQEVNVAPNLTVAQPLWLGSEKTRNGFLDQPAMLADARTALRDFDLDIDPEAETGTLDLATQQLVLIVRALSKNARLLILDEPTAALNEREASRLFARMKTLSEKGVAIIFVSHRLAEVFAVSDRIVVMRDGSVVGDFNANDVSREAVVENMIGTKVVAERQSNTRALGDEALAVHNLRVRDSNDTREVVEDVSFGVRRGEILGLFGLLGSGVVETVMALFGASEGSTLGEIRVDGKAVHLRSPVDAVAQGIGLISQDRRDGLVGDHTILSNSILANLDVLSGKGGCLDWMRARREISDISDRLRIKAETIDTLVGELSGGNQQKVQIARWLEAGVDTLLLVDPTRGVDVGARSEITRIWMELADAGAAILIVSSDAEELSEVCDRALVFRHGRIAQELSADELTEHALLQHAAGL